MSIADLGPTGRELYESLVEGREVSAAQRALVVNAARLADKADELTAGVTSLTVVNSQGTTTVHPLISELRMVTSALSQLLAKLGVSELPRVRAGDRSIRDQLAERRAARSAG